MYNIFLWYEQSDSEVDMTCLGQFTDLTTFKPERFKESLLDFFTGNCGAMLETSEDDDGIDVMLEDVASEVGEYETICIQTELNTFDGHTFNVQTCEGNDYHMSYEAGVKDVFDDYKKFLAFIETEDAEKLEPPPPPPTLQQSD
jgi:hypothetical protein